MLRQITISLFAVATAASIALAGEKPKGAAKVPDPPFIISQVRIQDSKSFDYFYVSGSAKMEQMPIVMGKLMGKLEAAIKEAARKEGKVVDIGGPVAIYTMTKPDAPISIQVGSPTEGEAKPIGDAKVRKVEGKRTASLIYVGPLTSIAKAYQALEKAIKDKGLTAGGERREFYLYWEGQDSANNVYMLQATVKE
jgi:effector-binding domain-containing protein